MGVAPSAMPKNASPRPRIVEPFVGRLTLRVRTLDGEVTRALEPTNEHVVHLLDRMSLPQTARAPEHDIIVESAEPDETGRVILVVSGRAGTSRALMIACLLDVVFPGVARDTYLALESDA
jgi:hypothetical protein